MIERELELEGVRLGYRELPGSGPLVVFCHGNSASSEGFEPLVRQLGADVHALALDWYGHGRSALPADGQCSVPALAALLVRFVAARTQGEYFLVGHSLGGHAAMEALPRLSERCRGLLSIAAPPFSRDTIAQVFRDPVAGRLFRDELGPSDAECIANALFEAGNVPDERVRAAALGVLATRAGVRSAIGESVATGAFADELAACRGSDVPVRFVQGRRDPFINCAYYQQLPRLLQREASVLFLEAVGHSPHLEAVPQVASEVMELIGR